MEQPRHALDEAGAMTMLISKHTPTVQGWHHKEPGQVFDVDVPLNEAHAKNFDALVLPGGVMNADALRMEQEAIDFIRGFTQSGKPIAAICHAPWALIEAGFVKGKKLTSYPSLETDLKNAGATWVDAVVVEEPGLITSQKPSDLPVFNEAMLRLFSTIAVGARA